MGTKITPEIIEALKRNKVAFGLMGTELQEAMLAIPVIEAIEYMTFTADLSEVWFAMSVRIHPDRCSCLEKTYRLRKDYQPESDIVEYEIRIGKQANCKGLMVYVKQDGDEVLLSEAIDNPDFIGFKFESGVISALPVNYNNKQSVHTCTGFESKEVMDKVLHASHVLFKAV